MRAASERVEVDGREITQLTSGQRIGLRLMRLGTRLLRGDSHVPRSFRVASGRKGVWVATNAYESEGDVGSDATLFATREAAVAYVKEQIKPTDEYDERQWYYKPSSRLGDKWVLDDGRDDYHEEWAVFEREVRA